MLFTGAIPGPSETQETPATRQNELTANGDLDPSHPETVLRLADGRSLVLPTELLIAASDQPKPLPATSSYPIPGQPAVPANGAAVPSSTKDHVFPLAEERAEVTKRLVETAKVRIHRSSEQFNQTVTLPLTSTTYDIERIPINQLLPSRPEVRFEGETTIYPLVEERFVAKREYFLIEEVHVTRTAKTTEQTATLELQRDILSIEKEPLVDALP